MQRSVTPERRPGRRRTGKALVPPALLLELSGLFEGAAKIAIIAIAIVVLLAAAEFASYVVAPAAAGILLGMTIGPRIDWLERRGISPLISSGGFVVLFLGVVALVLGLIAAPLEAWTARLPEAQDKFRSELTSLQGPLTALQEVEEEVERATSGAPQARGREPVEVVVKQSGIVTEFINTAPEVAARLIIFIGTLYFFAATRSGLRTSFLSLCATRRSQLKIARIFRDTEFLLSRYIATVTLVNIGLGVAISAAMFLLGVPSPLFWGAMGAVVNFVPYVGMIFMTAVIAGVGLLSFDSLAGAFLPAAVYLGLNAIEGQFVTPILLGRSLTLNPLLVFLAIAFWLWLWGPLGAFLAVPLVIAASATLHHILPRQVAAGTAPSFGKPAASASGTKKIG